MAKLRIWYLVAFAVMCTEFAAPLFVVPGISQLVTWWELAPPTDFLNWSLLAAIAGEATNLANFARDFGMTTEAGIFGSAGGSLFALTWILVLWAFFAFLAWAVKSYKLGFVAGILNLVSVLMLFFLFIPVMTPVMNHYGYSYGAILPSFGLGLSIASSIMMIAGLPLRRQLGYVPRQPSAN